MTTPYYSENHVTLYHGDCLDVLRGLPDASVDAIVTDPPYGISFMGKQWDQPDQYGSQRRGGDDRPFTAGPVGVDHLTTTERSASMHAGKYDLSPTAMLSFQQWCAAWATECLRILKPGGHLLAFGGSRTWHRLACAVEDAGFEIRDSIAWLYGSGFPKSLDVSKAIDKAAGAEREVVGRGQYADRGRVASGMQVDVGDSAASLVTAPATPEATRWQGWGTALKPAFEPIVVARKPLTGTVAGNVLAHGTGALNIDACRIATTDNLGGGAEAQTTRGQKHEGWARPWMDDPTAREAHAARVRENVARAEELGRWPTNVTLDDGAAAELDEQTGTLTSGKLEAHHARAPKDAGILGAYGSTEGERGYGDSGGASRFFPVFRYEAKADNAERPRVDGVSHPTVKPLALMQWMARLVVPPGGVVLDPFAGSGTTVEACLIEGFNVIAIEREAEYLPLIEARIARRTNAARALELAGEDLGLFGLLDDTEDGAA